MRNKTFFFANFEGTVIHNAQVWNTHAVTPAMEQGNFSALDKTIIDPLTKTPFPGNIIPKSRFSRQRRTSCRNCSWPTRRADSFRPNRNSNNTWEGTGRIDQEITHLSGSTAAT